MYVLTPFQRVFKNIEFEHAKKIPQRGQGTSKSAENGARPLKSMIWEAKLRIIIAKNHSFLLQLCANLHGVTFRRRDRAQSKDMIFLHRNCKQKNSPTPKKRYFFRSQKKNLENFLKN